MKTLQEKNAIDYERRLIKQAHRGSKSAVLKLQALGLGDYTPADAGEPPQNAKWN